MNQDGRLLARGRHRLCVWRIDHVARAVDVGELGVSQRFSAHVDEPRRVGQRRLANERGRALRRHDWSERGRAGGGERVARGVGGWPLHDIAITNIVC